MRDEKENKYVAGDTVYAKVNMTQDLSMTKRSFNRSTSAITKQPKIAYFILVHRFPKQFKRLFKAIYDPENHYLIHVDLKAEGHVMQDIQEFLDNYSNAFIMKRQHVVWGGYSMVQSELDGMKHLLSKNIQWDFFINLSGQDFPLKSQKIIRDFLKKNRNKNFIKVANQAIERPNTMNRLENYFQETSNGFTGKPFKRALMKDVTFYIGGQWMILTRSCCEFICSSSEVRKFENFYRNTLIADESFFQTVLKNTSFNETIVNDDKRAIIWVPDGDIKLRPKTLLETDLAFLLDGKNLFARKFDEDIDALVLDILESTLSSNKELYQSNITDLVNMTRVTPEINHYLADRVLVQADEAEEKSKGGIIIPDTAKESPQKGKVLAVGKGKKDEPMTVQVGDSVLYGKYSGAEESNPENYFF